MSTQTQTPAAEGWRLLNANAIVWDPSTPEHERNGWQYSHASGLKTAVCPTPGAALKAKNELLLSLAEDPADASAKDLGDAAPEGGEVAQPLVSGDAPYEGDVRPLYHEFKAGPDGGCCFFGCLAAADDPIHGEPPDDASDDAAADTAGPEDPVDEGEEQPDGFPNPGAGFSRGLGAPPDIKSEATYVGRPDPSLFKGHQLTGDSESPLISQIHPSKVTTHPSTLMRAGGIDPDHVEDLRAELRAGRGLPPIDVFFDGVTHWLGDGNHRHAAAAAEDTLLDVRVHKGSLRDAILFAVRSNASHGLKRTNDDKRLAVVTLLADEEWGLQSDTSVASLADVTQPFVGKVQAWLVKLLPVLRGDGVEDPSDVPDEEFAARAGAPDGLVSAVRSLTDAQLSALSHNVMARAESRIASDGKRVNVERPAAEEPPPLLPLDAGEQGAPDGAGHDPEVSDSFMRLIDALKAAGAKGATAEELAELGIAPAEQLEELIQRGKVRRRIERFENGRCYYLWSPAEVAAVVELRPRITPRELDELGCQDHVVRVAEKEGLIKPGSGDYTIGPSYSPAAENRGDTQPAESEFLEAAPAPGEAPAATHAEEPGDGKIVVNDRRRFVEEAATTTAAATHAPQAPPRPSQPTIEELLKGRPGALSIAWIPGLKGKVNVTVNVGGKPANEAKRFMLDASKLPPLPEEIVSVIKDEAGGKSQPKTGGPPAQPPPKKEAPAPKVERILSGIRGADTAADLDKVSAYFKLDDLSPARFPVGDAKRIKDALSARRRKVTASAKKSSKKGAAKSSAKKGSAKKGSVKSSAKKSGRKK